MPATSSSVTSMESTPSAWPAAVALMVTEIVPSIIESSTASIPNGNEVLVPAGIVIMAGFYEERRVEGPSIAQDPRARSDASSTSES